MTLSDIFDKYIKYVKRKYRNTIVVFNSYSEKPTTKDCTHTRRRGSQPGVTAEFQSDLSLKLQTKKEVFFSNPKNQQIHQHFGIQAGKWRPCPRGRWCINSWNYYWFINVKDTVVTAEDIDILVLLIYPGRNVAHSLWFHSPPKKSSKGNHCWNIQATTDHLGNLVCDNILFLYSFVLENL